MSEPLSGDPEALGRMVKKMGEQRPAVPRQFPDSVPDVYKKHLSRVNVDRKYSHDDLNSTESKAGADNKGIKRVNDEAAERLKRAFHEPGEKKDPKTELLDSRRKFGPKHPIGDGGVHDTDGPVKPRDPHAFLRKTESEYFRQLDEYKRDLISKSEKLLEEIKRKEQDPNVGRDPADSARLRAYIERMHDVAVIEEDLRGGHDRHLVYLDLNKDDVFAGIKSGVSVGDPFNADHVGLATPGKGTTTQGTLRGMTDEMDRIQRETLHQLRSMPGHEGDTAAVIAWNGYDAPQGYDDAADSRLAHAGAPVLDRFLHTIHDEKKYSHHE